jgi:hypothetical protein
VASSAPTLARKYAFWHSLNPEVVTSHWPDLALQRPAPDETSGQAVSASVGRSL